MEPDIRRDVRLLLFTGIRSHDSELVEPRLNCKLTIHSADLPSASFGFNKSVLVRASPRPIHCCQSNGAGYPKGCPAPLVYGYPLARQRRMSEQGLLWEAHYPLRGLMYNNERPHSALNYEPPSSRRRPHEGDTNQFNLESINTINNKINQVNLFP